MASAPSPERSGWASGGRARPGASGLARSGEAGAGGRHDPRRSIPQAAARGARARFAAHDGEPPREPPLVAAARRRSPCSPASRVRACGRRAARVEVGDRPASARRPVFRSTVTASGEIVAVRYADIGSSVMGKLVSLPVKEGDRVRRGQVVARIDSRARRRATRDAAAALVRAADADQAAARGPGRGRRAGARARPRAARARACCRRPTSTRSRPRRTRPPPRRTPRPAGARAGPRPARPGARPRCGKTEIVSPARRRRHPPAGAGGRDGRDRHPEHAGHDAHDDLRPRRGQRRGEGGRGRDPARARRPARDGDARGARRAAQFAGEVVEVGASALPRRGRRARRRASSGSRCG